MDLRQTLADISNDARGWLKAWAGDFTEDEVTRTVPGGPNPLAWQLGHLALVEDEVYTLFTGKPSQVPEPLRSACVSGGPSPVPGTAFPALAELWQMLKAPTPGSWRSSKAHRTSTGHRRRPTASSRPWDSPSMKLPCMRIIM
jgi:hypothetical protein